MGTVVVRRPPRQPGPVLPEDPLELEPPPVLSTAQGIAWSQMITIVPMLAGSAAMALMFSSGRGGPFAYVTGGLFGISMLGMAGATLFNQGGRVSKREALGLRRDYLRRLSQRRRAVRRTIAQQRLAMYYRHPDPDSLWGFVTGNRLWERRTGDSDFAVLRMGRGPLRLATPLRPAPTAPVEDLEPLSASALRRFVTTYAVVKDLPVAVAMRGFARIHVRAEQERAQGLVRALLAQAAVFHAPDDLLIAVCCSADRAARWDWAKWLPHALHPEKSDALGPVRLIGPTITGIEELLDDVVGSRMRFNPDQPLSEGPHVIVVVDGGDTIGSEHLMIDGGVNGVTVLDLSERRPRVIDDALLLIDIDTDGMLSTTTTDGTNEVGSADVMTVSQADGLARQLAPLRLSATSRVDEPLAAVTELDELLELGDPTAFEPETHWRTRPNRDLLRVPIGVSPDGQPIELDLKESAQEGMGPHGLLVGATGSGKSELLRTLVLALACRHSPEVLNLVLVDFKGGATFATLDKLPHTSAVITNLEAELSLVDRMESAIKGEMTRRQELLRRAGNFASQRDYERARAAGMPLDPLPSLLLICDEFSELLNAQPDFLEMFTQIGRVGRSLGVHLLLASQRLDEGRLRGLDTHLSYRIGLRTFSAMESRVALGVPDAAGLPRSPGHGFMKYGTEPLNRFKAAYVSGVHRRRAGTGGPASVNAAIPITTYVAEYVEPVELPPAPSPEPGVDVFGESLMDVLVTRMAGHGPAAHVVWLPPLDEPIPLSKALPPLTVNSQRGLTVSSADLQGRLWVPVALVDKPLEQRHDLLWLNLAGAAGHVIAVGAPKSGRTTLLRTMICAMALTHTPAEAQFYCLDFGGGALLSLRELPHVGGAWSRLDVDQVRRTIAEVYLVLQTREKRFAEHGIDSMDSYRSQKRAGKFADDPYGDVFLVVDGWSTLRSEFEDMEGVVSDIASRGLSFGIHLVGTATRWLDVRHTMRDLFGTRLELRLGDASDSEFGRRVATNVPVERPGRGLSPEGLHSLVVLPRIDGSSAVSDLAAGVEDLVKNVRAAWRGPAAPAVRLLPQTVTYESIARPAGSGRNRWQIPIGVAESDLQPVSLDFAADPHCILFADMECGKTAFLRLLARSIGDRYEPREAAIIAVDYRRSLLGSLPEKHLIAYASSTGQTEDAVAEIVTAMRERLPGSNVTAEELRSRSWWTGPELFLLVDDYDLVAGGATNPLLPLVEYAMQARDIGLHIVVTRRTGGAGRSTYETFMARLREVGSPGLVMSGDRDEGPLIGNVRPTRLPAGRGFLVNRRGGSQLVQLGWLPLDEA
ncbi:type VII secretion protein EccCa [Micromonospora sp. DT31]|uniref:type VII secretion protein EccCa n=1 Tax=Micromonospora sp. DT31 TaxID=3393434 RepID=UPI003CF238BA